MWNYRDKKIESHDDLDPLCTDFVYMITYDDGRHYIGKKAVRAIRRCPPLKGKKRNRLLMKNLPFMKYQGSHEGAKEMTPVVKEIIAQCSQRKAATYIETELLFENGVLFSDDFINENIGGTFFRNSLVGLLK